MRIALLGATGSTGRHFIDVALAEGHQVFAIVRSPDKLDPRDGLKVIGAQLHEEDKIAEALEGVDAVVSTLGVSPSTKDQPPSDDLPAVISAMNRAGVKRYVGISGAGVTLPGDEKNLMGKFISWLVRALEPAVYYDKVREHELLSASNLDWTLVRAPRLEDGAPTGSVDVSLKKPSSIKITRGDMSAFMLECARDDLYVGQTPFIAGG